jgi:thiamine biosynthesis lipoprotein
VQIDLGALLQGYAADRVAELLDDFEIAEYLINVGGELRCRGAWTVAIENPRDPAQPLRTIILQDAALATSGVYRRAADGSPETRHIISPQTGRPIESRWKLCAVAASTAIEADGWATALLASDPNDTLAIARRERLSVLLVDDAGEVHATGDFPAAVTGR